LDKNIYEKYLLQKSGLLFLNTLYIQFLCCFGPALTGMTLWNNNKTTKPLGELLTITDEAFIHHCIINYSATWKAQEEKKYGKQMYRLR
jgi:hypothetical protein